MRIETDLGALGVREMGERGAAPSVLLAHSLFVDARSWDEVAAALAPSRHVVLVDGPGMGSSAPCPRLRYTLDDCADAFARVVRSLTLESLHWVGHAWGGHVGVVLAARREPWLQSLVGIACPLQALESRAAVRMLVGLYRCLGARGPVIAALRNAMIAPERRMDRSLVSRFDAMVRDQRRRDLHRAMHSVMLGRESLVGRLDRVEVPTLLVAGEDPVWPGSRAREQARALRDGRVEELPGTRHLQPLEAPAEVTGLLRQWIARHD